MDVSDKVREFIVDSFLFGRRDTVITEDDSLLEKGMIDSTGVLEIVAFLEEQFGFSVEDEDIVPENLDSIRKISSYVHRKTNAAT
jgi:acyl carrier protein